MRSKVDQKLALKLTPNSEDKMDTKIYRPKLMIIEFLLGLNDLVRTIKGTHKTTDISINILEYTAFPTTNGKNVEGVTIRGMNRTQKTKIFKHNIPALTREYRVSMSCCCGLFIWSENYNVINCKK